MATKQIGGNRYCRLFIFRRRRAVHRSAREVRVSSIAAAGRHRGAAAVCSIDGISLVAGRGAYARVSSIAATGRHRSRRPSALLPLSRWFSAASGEGASAQRACEMNTLILYALHYMTGATTLYRSSSAAPIPCCTYYANTK